MMRRLDETMSLPGQSRPRRVRRGFSLIEMMLATAVLLGCVVVLGELAGMGNHHIESIEGRSMAEVICQATLNEMLSGAATIESYEKRTLDDYPGWAISSEVSPVGRQRVVSLRVSVWYEGLNSQQLDSSVRRKHFVSLVRWVRDPDAPLPAEERPASTVPFSLLDQIGGGQSQ